MVSDLGHSGSSASRRELLKKAAVGGAVVWTAPAIVAVSPVGAQASPGACGPAECDGITVGPVQYQDGSPELRMSIDLQGACPGAGGCLADPSVSIVGEDNVSGTASVDGMDLVLTVECLPFFSTFDVLLLVEFTCGGFAEECCIRVRLAVTTPVGCLEMEEPSVGIDLGAACTS